jgi:hypothetical protein
MEQLLNNTPIDWVQITDPSTGKVYFAPTSYVYPPKSEGEYTNIEDVNIGNTIISASVFLGTADYTPYIEFYKGDGSIFTSSLDVVASTASYALNAESASYALTASYALNGGTGGSTDTGSLLTTASFTNPLLEFEKGNGSGFALNLSSLTVTSSLTASYIDGGTF